MKKKVVIPTALLIAALVGGGLLYFTHIRPLEKVAAAPSAAAGADRRRDGRPA